MKAVPREKRVYIVYVELVGQKLRDIHYSVVLQVEKFKFHLATTEKNSATGAAMRQWAAAAGRLQWMLTI